MRGIKIVKIEWEDITFFNGHYNLKKKKIENFEIQKFQTIGFLLEKTKDYVLIALTYDINHNEEVGDVYKFPIGCVKKIQFIK